MDSIATMYDLKITHAPDAGGHFGMYGGRFAAETLMQPLKEIEEAFFEAWADPEFHAERMHLLKHYVGRATPLYHAKHLTAKVGGAQIYLKREDLNHTGAHKINNTIGQALLARRMGKKKVIAETGAGQHGVATATVAAMFNMQCDIYMGREDIRRQEPNVFRMKLLGANVVPVDSGTATLKDAVNEALRVWVATCEDTYYIFGTAAGPHPFPLMVRQFHTVIGQEARAQCLDQAGKLPDVAVACVGGGSNAMGLLHPFRDDNVRLVAVEAAGHGLESGEHAAALAKGRAGIIHGSLSYLLDDDEGQVQGTHSISAGLDYPGVGPELAAMMSSGRLELDSATDDDALEAFKTLTRSEGIIPALESSHALAAGIRLAASMQPDQVLLINLSGRGDKDLGTVMEKFSHLMSGEEGSAA
ncbi:MAG: tryptophan synthase subunit beta [Zetaproteobacteria bacterium CG_4_9_14_3_um_filter_49_83]|nr:MAG: tryptophan synthase subunit beta [Zetaproteobacteria bacterium CG17_big_fil_post_rev_8_21_14_2_50_50_13]PIV30933.1 MAG: tryptophan synthase subunit beta [Zetaproteobacteria bacterium CG02_land_8_20_14_3_00_50_9]PIY56409.1 MAG: tryptophan synthase subunit beta [Zetaproteobacteria bacterium CG_4_10_14_0_8_um_filter_49_80]PJA34048.1 MAG: tryptophan synthase subunit beta [Zetaproteobacteria bacterium CG_4_9_14_3_um_filter_49_83]